MVLAISLDGRLAPPQGGAAQLGGRGDRQVLEEALAWADGCLIGAETLRRHGSTCLIHDPALRAQRHGEEPQPIAIAVTRGRGLPADLAFFRQPLRRWQLILAAPAGPAAPTGTGGGTGADPRADPSAPAPQGQDSGFERQWRCPTWSAALAALAAAGLRRVVVLGGAALAGSLVAEGLLDELQLSLCPLLLGGSHPWLPTSLALPQPWRWQLREQRLLEGDELMLRYQRAEVAMPAADPPGLARPGANAAPLPVLPRPDR